ncbi:MAG: GMC family oxidoreductase [Alcanivoracaceae bacterium]|nr:GMC family oxidoreductase [Alcanivoracaceae bacterium]
MRDGILEYTDFPESQTLHTQVCIIGSGCGGATLAKRLTDFGIDVILLEQGGYYPARDMDQNELNMAGKITAERNLSTSHDNGNILAYGQNLGGASVHYWADSYRTPQFKLDEWELEYGVSGHQLKDLEPAFSAIERDLNIHPATEEYFNTMNQLLRSASQTIGWHGHHVPQARKHCVKSGHCMQGCLYDAKQSQMVTHIPTAIKQGARVIADAKAGRLEFKGNQAESLQVQMIDRRTNRPSNIELTVKAKHFVVAAGGFNSSYFLMKQGLQEKLPALGKYFSMNPSTVVHGIYDRPITLWRNIPAAYCVDEFVERRYRNGSYTEGGFLIMANQMHPGALAASLPGFSDDHAQIMEKLPHLGGTVSWLDDLPDELGEIRIDGNGNRVVHYEYGPKTQKVMKSALSKQAEVQFSAGAKEIIVAGLQGIRLASMADIKKLDDITFTSGGLFLASPHPGGGCRMGVDDQNSVVDYTHKVHGYANLFVSDSSVFPTSSALDPSLTIMAFSYRAADHIKAALGA